MARFFIEAPHNAAECRTLQQTLMSAGASALARFDFACAAGDGSTHFAVAIVEAWNVAEVLDSLPAEMLNAAQVTEVAKYFPEEIRDRR